MKGNIRICESIGLTFNMLYSKKKMTVFEKYEVQMVGSKSEGAFKWQQWTKIGKSLSFYIFLV